jgi:hypothetical protein
MNIDTITRIIQLVLAPVVIVTACSILVGSLQQRYALINERLRALSRELFDFNYAERALAEDNPRAAERQKEINFQIPLLLKRHRLAHHAVLAVYCAAAIQIIDMFVIALVGVYSLAWLAPTVLLLFLSSLLLLLAGVVFTALEIWSSRRAVEYEVERVLNAPKP